MMVLPLFTAVILIFISFFPIIWVQLFGLKPFTEKSFVGEQNSIEELEQIIIAVLESWNQKNLVDAQQYYTPALMKKHERHLTTLGFDGKKVTLKVQDVAGLIVSQKRKGKISVKATVVATTVTDYPEEWYYYPSVTRTRMLDHMIKGPCKAPPMKVIYVQRWSFIRDDNKLKVQKFSGI
jgi:hypothetical protein